MLAGEANVGKSAILSRFITGTFDGLHPQHGETHTKTILINGNELFLDYNETRINRDTIKNVRQFLSLLLFCVFCCDFTALFFQIKRLFGAQFRSLLFFFFVFCLVSIGRLCFSVLGLIVGELSSDRIGSRAIVEFRATETNTNCCGRCSKFVF